MRSATNEGDAPPFTSEDMNKVTLKSLSPFLFRDLHGPRAGMETDVEAELYLPEGQAGPHAAMVVLPGLGGIKEARERAYGKFFADLGYVALVPDCFGSRGLGQRGDFARALRVTEAMIAADAFAALAFLAGHPAVDRQRIAVGGFSYGGMVAVLAAYRQVQALFLDDGTPPFAGHVSYYGCSVPRLERTETNGAPVLMMLGGKDGNVSVERSRRIADDLRQGGSPVDFIVYDDAYHQWDGDDAKPRRVPFHLRTAHLVLGADDVLREERTGWQVRGPVSRGAILAAVGSPVGYLILKNRDATERSNEAVRGFLSRSIAASPVSGGDSAALCR